MYTSEHKDCCLLSLIVSLTAMGFMILSNLPRMHREHTLAFTDLSYILAYIIFKTGCE